MWWVKKIIAYTIIWTPVVGCLLLLSFCAGAETPPFDESPYVTVVRGVIRIVLIVGLVIGLGAVVCWAEKTIREEKPYGS